jgi:hypothetical protein
MKRTTTNSIDNTLAALQDAGIPVSSVNRDNREVWLGLLHGTDAWCRVGIGVEERHFHVTMRAFAEQESLGYVRWRYEELIDDLVEVGAQQEDEYGLAYCDMSRSFTGLREMTAWVERMIDTAMLNGLEFESRHGFDFSPDSFDMAWHFLSAA